MALNITAWNAARAEHHEVVAEFLATINTFPEERWHSAPRPNKWSAATLADHVTVTYTYGRNAATTGTGMRLLVPRPLAWAARTFILPRMLSSKRFPRGAEAPAEVRPVVANSATLSKERAAAELTARAAEALAAFERAVQERPTMTVTHAYFGPLPLVQTLRMLNAHTRHHAQGMRWRLDA
jgi:DinB superfamily